MSRSPTETSREVREAAEAMAQRSYPDSKTAPGEILELFKGGYLSVAETITALDDLIPTPAQAEPERLPTHGGLLVEINRAAHSAGTNAWVRDVLKRAHRAIRDLAPVVSSTHLCTGADDLEHLDGMLDDRERGS